MKKFIQIMTLSIFSLFTTSCLADTDNETRKTPLLKSYPHALRLAVADAYLYALIAKYDRAAQMSEEIPMDFLPNTPLCDIKDVRNLSSAMLLQQCRVFYPAMDSKCQDISGCISLKIHPSLRDDDELYELLISRKYSLHLDV